MWCWRSPAGSTQLTIGPLWRRAARVARQARGRRLVFDLGSVSFCDVSGAAFLAETEAAHGEAAELADPPEQVAGLLQRARAARMTGVKPQADPPPTAGSWSLGTPACRGRCRLRWRGGGGTRAAATATPHAPYGRSAALH